MNINDNIYFYPFSNIYTIEDLQDDPINRKIAKKIERNHLTLQDSNFQKYVKNHQPNTNLTDKDLNKLKKKYLKKHPSNYFKTHTLYQIPFFDIDNETLSDINPPIHQYLLDWYGRDIHLTDQEVHQNLAHFIPDYHLIKTDDGQNDVMMYFTTDDNALDLNLMNETAQNQMFMDSLLGFNPGINKSQMRRYETLIQYFMHAYIYGDKENYILQYENDIEINATNERIKMAINQLNQPRQIEIANNLNDKNIKKMILNTFTKN